MTNRFLKRTLSSRSSVLLLVGVWLATDAGAQAARKISNTSSCAGCRIETVSSVLLRGEPIDKELVQPPFNVVSGLDGMLYVLRDGGALAYRDNGQYVRSLARVGSGPGEVRLPVDLWTLPGDSLLLFDAGNQRVVVFDRLGRAARQISFPLRFRNGIVLRWPDSVVMSGPLGTPNGAGWPLHLLSFRDKIATVSRTFGAGDGQLQHGRDLAMQHLLARSRTGGWLSIQPGVYEITKWTNLLAVSDRFVRTPDWLMSESNMSTGTRNTEPSPRIRHIVEDRNGLMWVYAWTAAPTWREMWAGVDGAGRRELSTSRLPVHKLYVTRVDVLDLKQGSLLASTILQGMVIGTPGEDRIAVYHADLMGVPQVRITQLRLVRGR